jgi:hypothetical protein
MADVIHVERDLEGVQEAIVALFEESFQRSSIKDAMTHADADTRERMLAELTERQLSPGYYTRASYLLDLGSAIESGVPYSAMELTRDDVRGLAAVARARNAFYQEHPSCSACGERQDNRFAPACRKCGAKFGRGDN